MFSCLTWQKARNSVAGVFVADESSLENRSGQQFSGSISLCLEIEATMMELRRTPMRHKSQCVLWEASPICQGNSVSVATPLARECNEKLCILHVDVDSSFWFSFHLYTACPLHLSWYNGLNLRRNMHIFRWKCFHWSSKQRAKTQKTSQQPVVDAGLATHLGRCTALNSLSRPRRIAFFASMS